MKNTDKTRDRDSIYFRPMIKTFMPLRLNFNETFRYLRNLHRQQWAQGITRNVNINSIIENEGYIKKEK